MIDRVDDILGIQGLAIVEFDAPAKLEGPLLGVGRGLPALGELGDRLAPMVHLDQAVPQLQLNQDGLCS